MKRWPLLIVVFMVLTVGMGALSLFTGSSPASIYSSLHQPSSLEGIPSSSVLGGKPCNCSATVRSSSVTTISSQHLQPLPTLRYRDQLGMYMNQETSVEYKIGAELGVQRGIFSRRMMEVWPKSTEYWLVDLWSQQANYTDAANMDNETQETIYETALRKTKQWEHKIKICRGYTSTCAPKFQDGYFDFIYVDARHDFKGVLVDMDEWWPKLKVGGIFAGHDYIEKQDMRKGTRQDWTRNFDGTIDRTRTIVRGAVELFFTDSIWGVAEMELVELRKLINTPQQERMRSIKLTYRDGPASWYCRK